MALSTAAQNIKSRSKNLGRYSENVSRSTTATTSKVSPTTPKSSGSSSFSQPSETRVVTDDGKTLVQKNGDVYLERNGQLLKVRSQGTFSGTIALSNNQVQNQSYLQPNMSIAPSSNMSTESQQGYAPPPSIKTAKQQQAEMDKIRSQLSTVTIAPKRNKLKEFGLNLFSGAGFTQSDQTRTTGQILRTGKPSEVIPTLIGTIAPYTLGNFGSSSKIVSSASKTAQTVRNTRIAQQAYKLGTQTQAGKFAVTTGKVIVGGELARVGITTALKKRANKAGVSILESPQYQGVESEIEKRFDMQINKGGVNIPFTQSKISLKGIASEALPAGNILVSKFYAKNQYEDTAKEVLRQQGLKGADLTQAYNAAVTRRSARGAGEVAGFLGGTTLIELGGRGAFSLALQNFKNVPQSRAFGKMFVQGAKITAPLGFVEAGSQAYIQQKQRLRPISIKNIALEGGIGAISAGTLGGFIPAAQIAKTTTTRAAGKVAYGVGNIFDPLELIGDVSASQIQKVQKNVFKMRINTPSLTLKGVNEPTLTFSDTLNGKKQNTLNVKSSTYTPSINYNIPQITPSKINIPSIVPINIPTNLDTKIGSNIITPTPTDTPTITDTIVQTNTNTNIPTLINTQSFTPIFRAPPPLVPLGFGLGGSMGVGTRKGKQLAYANELNIGLGIIRGSLGIGRIPTVKSIKKKQSTKKKTKKKRKK